MQFPSSSSKVNTIILLIFLAMWIYTEVTEDIERNEYRRTVFDFMQEVEHDRLLERVIELEADVDELTGD